MGGTSDDCGLVRILVLRFVILKACTHMVSRYATKLEHDLLLSVFLCVKVEGARWLTPTKLPSRSMHSSTLL